MVHLKHEINLNGNKWTKHQRVGLLPLGPCWNCVLALPDFCQTGKTTKDDDKTYLKSLQMRGEFRESDSQMKMTSYSDSTPSNHHLTMIKNENTCILQIQRMKATSYLNACMWVTVQRSIDAQWGRCYGTKLHSLMLWYEKVPNKTLAQVSLASCICSARAEPSLQVK